MNTITGAVERTVANIGAFAIELSREKPTSGKWFVAVTSNGMTLRRTFAFGPEAGAHFRRECEAALELSRTDKCDVAHAPAEIRLYERIAA